MIEIGGHLLISKIDIKMSDDHVIINYTQSTKDMKLKLKNDRH
jgi:hypothetical protein